MARRVSSLACINDNEPKAATDNDKARHRWEGAHAYTACYFEILANDLLAQKMH